MQNHPYFTTLLSAVFTADNHSDQSRTVDISANVHIDHSTVTGFADGHATLPDTPGAVCDFSESNGSYLATTFHNYPDDESRLRAQREINAFIAAIRAEYSDPS